MKTILGVVVLAGALLTAVVMAAGPEAATTTEGQPAAAPQAVVPDVAVSLPADQPAVPLQMVELTFSDGKTVTGRLVKEDDQTVYVAAMGGGSIGYQHALIKSARRFTMSAAEFAEKAADVLADQLWKVQDAPGMFVKARLQYQAAIGLAPAAEDRNRILAKLASLERERDAWQAESLRRSEMQKAKDEADLVRLQKELAQAQLATLQTFEPRLRQVEQDLRRATQALAELQDASARTGQAVADLLNQQRNPVAYVPVPVIVDPKRPHDHDDPRPQDDHSGSDVPKP